MRELRWSASVTALMVWCSAAAAIQPEDLAELPHFVDEIRDEWRVPGASVAVVSAGEVVYTGGCGTLSSDDPTPITSSTVFAIGSATKAFTALHVALLVEEGRLDWDRPVRHWLPSFGLKDGTAALHTNLRDLLHHRTGLPRHDAVWYRASFDRDELVRRMVHLDPVAGFRDRFTYSNLPYAVAGRVVEAVEETTWERSVRQRVLEPLGMRRTWPGPPPANVENVAVPHENGPDGRALAMRAYDGWSVGPALAIHSTAEDMARWLQLQLSPGHPDRPALLPDGAMRGLHVPRMVVSTALSADRPIVGYAAGWMVESYRGRPMIWHAGHLDGFYALVAFFPYEDLGVAVLTNRSRNRVPEIVVRWAADRFLGLGEIDWNRRYLAEKREIENIERQVQDRIDALRNEAVPPSAELGGYVGTFIHPAYGSLIVDLTDGVLSGVFHGIPGTIEHLVGDQFLFTFDAPELDDRFVLGFAVTAGGVVDAVATVLEEGVPPVVFERLSDSIRLPRG